MKNTYKIILLRTLKRMGTVAAVYVLLGYNLFAGFQADGRTECWTLKPTPTTNNLFSCSFTDNQNGWAVGAWGTVIHTTDGGSGWVLQNEGLEYPFVSVCFTNSRKGWIVGNANLYSNPVIVSTTNAGMNWQYYNYPDTLKIFRTICFSDSINGYIGTYNGEIIKTTNGGMNWFEIPGDSILISRLGINKFAFYGNKNGLAAGGAMDMAGVFRKTTNFGYIWQSSSVASEPLNDIRFIDSNYIIGVGGDFEFGSFLYRSTNSGINYTIEYFPTFAMSYSLAPRTKSEYWISTGFTKKLLLTADSGNTFTEIPAPGNASVYDIYFKDTLNGWCVGTGGMAAKYNYSSVGITEEGISISVKTFRLLQNYPNPFNPTTTIDYQLPADSRVSLIIYDVSGREIRVLINNEFKKAGYYTALFNAGGLSSGVYFYRIIAEGSTGQSNYTLTKKLILLK